MAMDKRPDVPASPCYTDEHRSHKPATSWRTQGSAEPGAIIKNGGEERNASGGGSVQPPAAPCPADDRPPGSPLPPVLLLHIAAVLCNAAAQLVITICLWAQASNTHAQWQTAVTALAKVVIAYFVVRHPLGYWKRRNILVPTVRIALHLFPVVRDLGAGTALLLQRGPQPGVRGTIADLARILSGTRQLGVAVGGIALMMSPAATFVTQAALMLLTSNNAAYCSEPLLRHPLSQLRASVLTRALEYATMPVLVLQPIVPAESAHAAALLSGSAPPDFVCRIALLFLQISFTVVLPTLLAVHCWEGPETQQQAVHGAPAEQNGAAEQGSPSQQCSGSLWQRIVTAVDCAAAKANAWLYFLLYCPEGTMARAAAAAWAFAVTWWFCKWSQGLH